MPLKVPPVNAQVTKIESVEWSDDYDPVQVVVDRWAGSAPAYQTEKHEQVEAQGGGTILSYIATLAIPSTLPVEVGDYVTTVRNGSEQRRVVDALEDRADAGFHRLFVKDVG